VRRVDDALYELESTMQAGNQNATATYLLSQVEKAGLSATEFATAFNNYIADGPEAIHDDVIRMVTVFSSAIADVLDNAKGVTRLAPDEKKADQIISSARQSAQATVRFFQSLQSFRLDGLDPEAKTDVVLKNNLEVQKNLQVLTKLTETFVSKGVHLGSGDLGDIVDRELTNAAAAIDAAAARLAALQNKAKGPGYSTYELRIHEYASNLQKLPDYLSPNKHRTQLYSRCCNRSHQCHRPTYQSCYGLPTRSKNFSFTQITRFNPGN